MGSTPIHGIPFADPTDLVRDWPALSEDVALAIEAALENIPVTQKKIEAFTGSGTWTVPAGVTYAIAHMLGGGGGIGAGTTASAGGTSSVAFASGTVSAVGGARGISNGAVTQLLVENGAANSGRGASRSPDTAGTSPNNATESRGQDAQWIVAAAEVTPAASITVTVGGGGTAGTVGAAGGSGYVYIEFFEEV